MKLTDIPVIFICPDHNEKYAERKEYMFTLLHKLGFKHVTMFKSGTEEYPRCLAKATRDILREQLDNNPFLLFEDDLEVSEWANLDMDFDIPVDTDAFYLGFSIYGRTNTDYCNKIEYLSDKYIRILNMLSAHAILYVSKKYKQAVIDQMELVINATEIHHSDVFISRIQSSFNIYGYRYPFFYQSDKFGNPSGVKDATNFRF